MTELEDDAVALMDHFGLKNTAFVGLSIGGLIAQDIAAKRPDLVRLMVLSDTTARFGYYDL
jgi:3-oxoadipate enol-lactonase